MTVVSFVGVVGIVGGGAYVYSQKDAIIESAKEAAMEEISAAIPGLLSGAMGGSVGGLIPGGAGASASGTGSTGNLIPTPNAPLGLGF